MAHTAVAAEESSSVGRLGWQHVLQELQQPAQLLPWPDSLPPAGAILSEQLLQRVARRLRGIFCARNP